MQPEELLPVETIEHIVDYATFHLFLCEEQLRMIYNTIKGLYSHDLDHYRICNDDACINFKLPSRLSWPSDESIYLPITGQYKLLTISDINTYFEDCENGRIEWIWGLVTEGDIRYESSCTYCFTDLLSHHNKTHNYYYFCNDCQKDMCKLCYEATNTTENEDIVECLKNHHLYQRRHFNDIGPFRFTCDKCDLDIPPHEPRYTNFNRVDMFQDNTLDYCRSCGERVDVDITNLELIIPPRSRIDVTGFGSILDWIPLIESSEFYSMLVNMNPDATYYGRIALLVSDNHGRMGYHVTEANLSKNSVTEILYTDNDEILPIEYYTSQHHMRQYFG